MLDTFSIFNPKNYEESIFTVKQSFQGKLNTKEEKVVRSIMKGHNFNYETYKNISGTVQNRDTISLFDPVSYTETFLVVDKEVKLLSRKITKPVFIQQEQR